MSEIKLGDVVRLKKLKWAKSIVSGEEWYDAPTVFCELSIHENKDDRTWVFRWCAEEYYDEGSKEFESLKEAKRRAERWYLDRIRGAVSAISKERL